MGSYSTVEGSLPCKRCRASTSVVVQFYGEEDADGCSHREGDKVPALPALAHYEGIVEAFCGSCMPLWLAHLKAANLAVLSQELDARSVVARAATWQQRELAPMREIAIEPRGPLPAREVIAVLETVEPNRWRGTRLPELLQSFSIVLFRGRTQLHDFVGPWWVSHQQRVQHRLKAMGPSVTADHRMKANLDELAEALKTGEVAARLATFRSATEGAEPVDALQLLEPTALTASEANLLIADTEPVSWARFSLLTQLAKANVMLFPSPGGAHYFLGSWWEAEHQPRVLARLSELGWATPADGEFRDVPVSVDATGCIRLGAP